MVLIAKRGEGSFRASWSPPGPAPGERREPYGKQARRPLLPNGTQAARLPPGPPLCRSPQPPCGAALTPLWCCDPTVLVSPPLVSPQAVTSGLTQFRSQNSLLHPLPKLPCPSLFKRSLGWRHSLDESLPLQGKAGVCSDSPRAAAICWWGGCWGDEGAWRRRLQGVTWGREDRSAGLSLD